MSETANSNIKSDFTIDITRDTCPMTFVKTKLQLAKMKPGEVLEVILNDGEPLENVPKSSLEQGFVVLEVSFINGRKHRVIIRK